jgi:hypothetical protein
MLLPPALKWIDTYCDSLSTALGQTVTHSEAPTIIPLIYTIRLNFNPPITPRNKVLAWNMLEIFTSTNDSGLHHANIENPNIWVLDVIAKRRLGPERNEHPLGEITHDNNSRTG